MLPFFLATLLADISSTLQVALAVPREPNISSRELRLATRIELQGHTTTGACFRFAKDPLLQRRRDLSLLSLIQGLMCGFAFGVQPKI